MMIFISDKKEIINEEEKLMIHENWTKNSNINGPIVLCALTFKA